MFPATAESSGGEVRLADGRMLAWAAHGPADGRPVLFVAGAATGKSMTFADECLELQGIRLITVDRPGMGGSTPDPGRSLSSTARDLAEVVRRMSPDPVHVVANSQGAPFGLALAGMGAAAQLSLVAPADEVAVEPVRGMLPPAQRSVVDQVRSDPDGARAFLARLGAEGMEAMVLAGADDQDRAVYSSPHFLRRYRAALREGFANGGVGYATDTVLAMSPWKLDFTAIHCDVTLWIGERDRQHSPDQAVTLAQRITGSRRIVVPGAGGALLWTHGAQVLATDGVVAGPDQ